MMAERGTLPGELQAAWARFWGTRWRVKGTVLGVLAFFVIVGIAGAAGGSDQEEKEAASPDTETATSGSPAAATKAPTNTPVPTNTRQPTNTPTPRPTPTPVPPTPTPAPPGFTFSAGTRLVGTEVVAGSTYRTRRASDGCYWARLSGLSGTLADVEANDNADGPVVVTIAETDVAFESRRCATFTQDLSAITSDPAAPFPGDGTFIVNVDISPGIWRNDSQSRCYWARLRGFGGTISDIIANDNTDGPAVVEISASDAGFITSRCGTWTKIG